MGPLDGIRVADFTWVWAGPHATLQLAHLGAEVIRIEALQRPCVTRLLPPWPDGIPGANRSGYFNQFNQGKRSIVLDLKTPEGVDLARRLVACSDVAAVTLRASTPTAASTSAVCSPSSGAGVRSAQGVRRN